MDFGYKVIRNRLGSLVANAIQKKIDNNKGSEPFIVVIEQGSNNIFTTTVNSSEVIQSINQNKLVIYKIIANNGDIMCSCNTTITKYNSNIFVHIGVVSTAIGVFIHSGTTIEKVS